MKKGGPLPPSVAYSETEGGTNRNTGEAITTVGIRHDVKYHQNAEKQNSPPE